MENNSRYSSDDDNAIYFERLDDLYLAGENMGNGVKYLLAYFDSLDRQEATEIIKLWQKMPSPF